jgi:PAS domain S-box-containing protein
VSHTPPEPTGASLQQIDAIRGPAAALTPGGVVAHANADLARMLCISPALLDGTRFEEMIQPDERRRFRRLLATAARRGVLGEAALCRKDGVQLHTQLSLRRLRPPDPTVLLLAVDLGAHDAPTGRRHPDPAGAEHELPAPFAETGPGGTAAAHAPHATEKPISDIVHLAMDAILTVDEEQRIVLFNQAAEQMFRCPAADALGQLLDRFLPARVREAHRRHIQEFGSHGATFRRMGALGELVGLRADGQEFPIEASISRAEVGGRKFFTVILRDITERKRADEALATQNALLQAVLEQAADPIVVVDAAGVVLLANSAARTLYGTDPRGQPLRPVLEAMGPVYDSEGRLVPLEARAIPLALRGETVVGRHHSLHRPDGSRYEYLISAAPIRMGGATLGAVATLTDITTEKATEARLREAVADRDTLLHEVHHRVKNNLQMLGDLLYLQSEAVASPEAQRALRDAYARIFTIARLHEQLYRSMQRGQVLIQDYLDKLLEGLRSLYPGVSITLEGSGGGVALDLDRAIHVGLIVNELVTNALKHAFPDGVTGGVTVGLRTVGEELEILVRDNGRGLPPDLDLQHARTLGLRIVRTLARRLQAVVHVENDAGTAFTIRLPPSREADGEAP